MIANALFIANKDLVDITESNDDVRFYMHNVFNDYYLQLRKSNYYYVKDMEVII